MPDEYWRFKPAANLSKSFPRMGRFDHTIAAEKSSVRTAKESGFLAADQTQIKREYVGGPNYRRLPFAILASRAASALGSFPSWIPSVHNRKPLSKPIDLALHPSKNKNTPDLKREIRGIDSGHSKYFILFAAQIDALFVGLVPRPMWLSLPLSALRP